MVSHHASATSASRAQRIQAGKLRKAASGASVNTHHCTASSQAISSTSPPTWPAMFSSSGPIAMVWRVCARAASCCSTGASTRSTSSRVPPRPTLPHTQLGDWTLESLSSSHQLAQSSTPAPASIRQPSSAPRSP